MDQAPATANAPHIPVRTSSEKAVGLHGVAQRALAKAKSGLGIAAEATGEVLQSAGVRVAQLHRRLILWVAAMLGLLLIGAAARSIGWPAANYGLILLFGLGALYAFLHPLHLAGMALVGGGVAAARDVGAAKDSIAGYAGLFGRLLLAFLVPLLLFATGGGDTSFGASVRLIAFVPIVLLGMWLFGRLAPRVERALFLGVPLAALTLSAANLLVPQRALAAIGLPAWLRADRPQDDELARVEALLEQRRNTERAVQLKMVREKLESGAPLTPEDDALIRAAQADRVTLTGWAKDRYRALSTSVAAPATAPTPPEKPAVPLPPPGTLRVPTRGWSTSVSVPPGTRLCADAPRGTGSYRAQCHRSGGAPGPWHDESSGRCNAAPIDAVRFHSRGTRQVIGYRHVAAAAQCGISTDHGRNVG